VSKVWVIVPVLVQTQPVPLVDRHSIAVCNARRLAGILHDVGANPLARENERSE